MRVLADADEGHVDGMFADNLVEPTAFGLGVALAVDVVKFAKRDAVDQALFEVAAKRRGMVHRQADVLVEMETDDFRPVDVGLADEGR